MDLYIGIRKNCLNLNEAMWKMEIFGYVVSEMKTYGKVGITVFIYSM